MPFGPFPIWNGTPPDSLGTGEADIPTLTPFPADWPGRENAGPALLILPGGGYGGLADHEGKGFADWFVRAGIRCFVLKYRLGSAGYRHPTMLRDAARAMRLLRARSGELGVDPTRIGVIGSSAGGHLAATLLTKWDDGHRADPDPVERQSSRPDLGILCYPVVTMTDPFTHAGSRANLLGPEPTPEMIALLSAEKHVTPQTPPCFVWHTLEDPVVPVENVLLFVSALRAQGVPFAFHVYERGPHGIGLANHPWAPQALRWLSLRWPVRTEG